MNHSLSLSLCLTVGWSDHPKESYLQMSNDCDRRLLRHSFHHFGPELLTTSHEPGPILTVEKAVHVLFQPQEVIVHEATRDLQINKLTLQFHSTQFTEFLHALVQHAALLEHRQIQGVVVMSGVQEWGRGLLFRLSLRLERLWVGSRRQSWQKDIPIF
jgi:hypothetical protein